LKISKAVTFLIVILSAFAFPRTDFYDTEELLVTVYYEFDDGNEIIDDEPMYIIVDTDEPKTVIYDDNHEPEFIPVFISEPLPDYIIEFIDGLSFKENTTLTHDDLTYLTITHVDFNGENRTGNMIVAAELGEEVLEIFQEIYESGFPVYSIYLIDYFDACDDRSMAANNSSAFNFRYVVNTNRLSRHAFGVAIDINPVQNPYVRGETILPAAGIDYLDRTDIRSGMITPGDAVYEAFVSRGWTWGGNWRSLKDYHHFEK